MTLTQMKAMYPIVCQNGRGDNNKNIYIIYMKINTIVIIGLIILFVYLLGSSLIRYNTVIEGNTVTLDSSDIEHIYTNKQKLQNITSQQANIEAEIKQIQNEINPIKSSYKKKNKEMTDVTEKAEKEMKKQKKEAEKTD